MEPYKQDKKKYFCLLRELILNKQEAECETSFEDKFNDLKKDIINELRKMQKTRQTPDRFIVFTNIVNFVLHHDCLDIIKVVKLSSIY